MIHRVHRLSPYNKSYKRVVHYNRIQDSESQENKGKRLKVLIVISLNIKDHNKVNYLNNNFSRVNHLHREKARHLIKLLI